MSETNNNQETNTNSKKIVISGTSTRYQMKKVTYLKTKDLKHFL